MTIPVSAGSNSHLVTTCGQAITSGGTWNLANDLGPCPVPSSGQGLSAGILVRHSGVTLNLNGHTITGVDTTNTTANQQVGIVLANVGKVVVNGPGTITAFDAGVAIEGGSGNTVSGGIIAHDNIAHVLLTGGVGGQGDPSTNPCDFGDGFLTDNSSGNVISNNTATHNGPFSGVALVDASLQNRVLGNATTNQTVLNEIMGNPNLPGPCGPFSSAGVGQGREDQDTGIRIEGFGAQNNLVDGNTSWGNTLGGIDVHSYICSTSPSFGGPPPTPDNSGNTISNNTVFANDDPLDPTVGNGIAILNQGQPGIVCASDHETITGNTVFNNANDGIFLGGRGTSNNTVSKNNVHDNHNDGIELFGGESLGNGTFTAGSINNTVKGNTVQTNGHDGIQLDGPWPAATTPPGATGNRLSGNTMTGNHTDPTDFPAGYDAEDDNLGCDSNTWSSNTFGSANQPCIH